MAVSWSNLNNRHFSPIPAAFETRTRQIPDDRPTEFLVTMGTPQISICAGEEVLRIALRVLQATHRTSEVMVAFFLRAPADLESVGRGGSTTITFVAKLLNHGLSLPTK